MTDRIGQQLGNYHLTRLLGQGGFADVYLGEHVYLGTNAAIKVLQTYLSNEADLEWFLNEARTIARLSHPNIVRVLDFGVENEVPFLVIEYAPNGTLRQRHPTGTILPLTTIISYTKQIADALQYAHDQKLIHRDIKPQNMLVGQRNELLLNDFGLALIAQSTRSQGTQDLAGTAAYISPEQIQGKPRTASDQYALGIVVYEWLCGAAPYSGSFTELCSQHLFAPLPPLKEKASTINPAVEQVVARALAKDPKQRFETISAFANALEEAASVQEASSPTKRSQLSNPSLPPPPSIQIQSSSVSLEEISIPATNFQQSLATRADPASASFNAFVHQAKSSTIRRNYTIIDNPLTNSNPNAIVMVTQNWNPGGRNGTYNNHPVGVWYNGRRWAIFNQDRVPMPLHACFNVTVLNQSLSVFVQVATLENSVDNYTIIDNPLTNGNPNAVVMVTQNWNPSGRNGTYNNHPVGVWYTPSGNWSIFNTDLAPMAPKVSFNVQILNSSPAIFIHQTTPANVSNNYTVFNNGATDGKANTIALVTQNWNPQGMGGIYNNHEIGVWYTPTGNWSIFNEDQAPMPLQAAFNIEIVQS